MFADMSDGLRKRKTNRATITLALEKVRVIKR